MRLALEGGHLELGHGLRQAGKYSLWQVPDTHDMLAGNSKFAA